jgi:hypothetical protein
MLTVPLADEDYRPAELGGASAVLWDDTLADQLFTAIRSDTPLPPRPAKAATVEVPPSQVSVWVRNATSVSGLAARASADLAAAGFQVTADPDNAPRQGLTRTVIRYDPRWDRSVKTVQAALPGAALVAVPGMGGQFEIWVGTSYDGVSPVTVTGSTATTGTSAKGFDTRTAADNPCTSSGGEG